MKNLFESEHHHLRMEQWCKTIVETFPGSKHCNILAVMQAGQLISIIEFKWATIIGIPWEIIIAFMFMVSSILVAKSTKYIYIYIYISRHQKAWNYLMFETTYGQVNEVWALKDFFFFFSQRKIIPLALGNVDRYPILPIRLYRTTYRKYLPSWSVFHSPIRKGDSGACMAVAHFSAPFFFLVYKI